MNEKVEKLANELGKAITESDEFAVYTQAKEIFEADEKLQSLIGDFNIKRMNLLQEMQKKDKDEAAFTKLQDEVRRFYVIINEDPNMAAFNGAQQALELLVNDAYNIIKFHVTGEQPGGCSGECSSCSGCH